MRANPLPDNATTNQFDARVNEFDTHVNPALEMQYTGENYVKLLWTSDVQLISKVYLKKHQHGSHLHPQQEG